MGKKTTRCDPSVDLSKTMESFTEILDDPGNEESKDMNREDVQNWFAQVNKHGMMLLYQSLNQEQKRQNDDEDIAEIMHNVPKVQYGQKNGVRVVDSDNDEQNETMEQDDLDVLEMEYEDRLNKETELDDLCVDESTNYIELTIKDQSVYWGDNLLLDTATQTRMNQVAKQLHLYLQQVDKKKAKLAEIAMEESNGKPTWRPKMVVETIKANTQSNSATSKAKMASEQHTQSKRKHGKKSSNVARDYWIFGQNSKVKAPENLLRQLSTFQKPMKELIRHYWACFPANHQRLKKSNIIVENLQRYKKTLTDLQAKFDKKNKMQQKILLQELIDLADKVIEHQKKTKEKLKQKKERMDTD